jgi:hypothetical protein
MRAEGKLHSSAPLVFSKVLSRLDICCHVAELQKSSANPSEEMRVLQVAYDEAQGELKNLETAALDVCHELEGPRVSPLVARWRAACGPWEDWSSSACGAPFVSASRRPWGLSYGPPWAHYIGGYQDRLLGGPLGLPGLRYTALEGVEHKDNTGVVLG